MTTLWSFSTARFTVTCAADYDQDVDLSWRDDAHAAWADANGVEYYEFDVTVTYRGRVIGTASLCGSGYSDPRDFVTAHRDPDPLNRNCSIMRAANGPDSFIGHYFPDMLREALAEARRYLAGTRAVRLRALS